METLHFESVKMALKQDATGFVLTLRIHPDQIPENLLRDFVGSRYVVAMVRVNDDEEPVHYNISRSNRAGMLCKNPVFQQFLVSAGHTEIASHNAALDAIYETCGITSRSELNGNKVAQEAFDNLVEEYEEYAKDTPF